LLPDCYYAFDSDTDRITVHDELMLDTVVTYVSIVQSLRNHQGTPITAVPDVA